MIETESASNMPGKVKRKKNANTNSTANIIDLINKYAD